MRLLQLLIKSNTVKFHILTFTVCLQLQPAQDVDQGLKPLLMPWKVGLCKAKQSTYCPNKQAGGNFFVLVIQTLQVK